MVPFVTLIHAPKQLHRNPALQSTCCRSSGHKRGRRDRSDPSPPSPSPLDGRIQPIRRLPARCRFATTSPAVAASRHAGTTDDRIACPAIRHGTHVQDREGGKKRQLRRRQHSTQMSWCASAENDQSGRHARAERGDQSYPAAPGEEGDLPFRPRPSV